MREVEAPRTSLDRVCMVLALFAYFLGAFARIRYGLFDHPARHFVVTDASNMLEGMARMVNMKQGRWDTIWPPGEMAFTALMSRLDATLLLAGAVQVLLSLIVPWLAADVARLMSNRRGFWFGLAAASLHLGFVHHVGFFLSEGLFQVAMAFAIWLLCVGLLATDEAVGSRLRALFLAFAAGGSFGLAALFRPNALPVVLALSVGLILLSYKARGRGLIPFSITLVFATSLVIAPGALRCTALTGKFCPVSSNFAMNLALGQAGERAGLHFVAKDGTDYSTWTPPALLDHGYKGHDNVPAGIFDSAGVLSWVKERVRKDPMSAAQNALRNATDTFRTRAWPGHYGAWPEWWFRAGAYAFSLFVLLPSLLGAFRVVRSAVKDPGAELPSLAGIMGLLAVISLAAISMGEARYRYPFDLWHIGLAVRAFSGVNVPHVFTRTRTVFSGLAFIFVFTSATLLACAFLPQISLAARLAPDPHVPVSSYLPRRPEDVGWHKVEGHAWNDGTVILPCQASCAELRVVWKGLTHASTVSLSTDHNDAYRVTFYRGRKALGFADLPLKRNGKGLHRHLIRIPKRALPFDNVGVMPLYGDAAYSVGDLRVR